ncbi:regulatory phage cox family protein [Shewanella psychrotolerans]|uniref:regulatory phage cox family protein n=1 Tax=Shewanella psychrotolerans TaxID=2864206 RepID=UPI001C662420|nr:regulatory phage cox family protein [Shewanella psychrotolerans]QYK02421.1 regulatory phage cox family protein [Shewanella psychrotolerans]
MSPFAYQIASPYVSYEEFARVSGIPLNTIRAMAKEGRLPTRPKNRPKDKPLINMLALANEAAANATPN